MTGVQAIRLACTALILFVAVRGRANEEAASFSPGCRVLFQGDSITDMNRGRTSDPNHILGHSYAFLVAARSASSYPERGVEFINRGVSGNTVADLMARWDTDTIGLHPTILSILIGVNDLDQGVPVAAFEANYDALLKRTVAELPGVKLVLCEPFGLPTGKAKAIWSSYRAELAMRQEVVARLSGKYNATLVRFQPIFDEACRRAPAENWIWDGIHPTYAGQQLLADEWTRVVNGTLGDPLLTPSRNSAIQPTVNRERDSYDWLHRHDDELELGAKLDPQLVMVGDSITHFWGGAPDAHHSNGPSSWRRTFAGVRVLNMGFGWDRTQNVLWRLEHGEMSGLHPQSVVLNIGTNNLVGDSTARTNTPEETAEGVVEVVNKIRSECPLAELFVMKIFPRGFELHNELDQRIGLLNDLLGARLQGLAHVHLLDVGPQMRNSDGSISKEVFMDGTHPTDRGYEIWGRALLKAGAVPG